MRRTVNIWFLIGVLACVLVAFFCFSGSLSKTVDELNAAYREGEKRLDSLESEQIALGNTLKDSTSDAFIESQARSKYGYMLPNEIRLVIDNPDELYGEQGVPSR